MDNIKRRSFLRGSLATVGALFAGKAVSSIPVEPLIPNPIKSKIDIESSTFVMPKGATSLKVTCIGGGGGGPGSNEFTIVNSYNNCSTIKVNDGDKIVIGSGGAGGNG